MYYRRKAVLFDEVWAGGLGTFVRDKASGDIYGFGLNNYNQMGELLIIAFDMPWSACHLLCTKSG